MWKTITSSLQDSPILRRDIDWSVSMSLCLKISPKSAEVKTLSTLMSLENYAMLQMSSETIMIQGPISWSFFSLLICLKIHLSACLVRRYNRRHTSPHYIQRSQFTFRSNNKSWRNQLLVSNELLNISKPFNLNSQCRRL